MKIGIDGVTIGHWTDTDGGTGCTVVVVPPGAVAAGEVRGGAPATREFPLLDPSRLVSNVDAVVLTGGSAFGLAAADGVVERLEAAGRGFPTATATVPIVVAMALYDLGTGSADARPDAAAGRAAFDAASPDPGVGRIGAGTGATVGKWPRREAASPGGIGMFTASHGELSVTAVVAVNAAGGIDDGIVAAAVADGSFDDWPHPPAPGENTTIGVVLTNATLDPVGCLVVAQGAHDGLARAVVPPHMRSDGDAFVAVATGGVEAHVDEVRLLGVVAVEQAVRGSVDTIEG